MKIKVNVIETMDIFVPMRIGGGKVLKEVDGRIHLFWMPF